MSSEMTGPARVAILGGGERELEIIRGFRAAGYEVSTFGTIESEEFAPIRAKTLAEAVTSADVVVGPMPGVGTDGAIYAPHCAEKIVVAENVFSLVKPGAIYFSGRSAAHTRAAAVTCGVEVHDIGEDDVVQMHHAVPTAEAAICEAIRRSDMPLLAQRCLVVGYGRIGTLLAHYLRGFGAGVTVAARRGEVRARAQSLGHQVCDTTVEELTERLKAADLVFVTASATLVQGEVLDGVRAGQLIVDLASPPGGVDHEGARERGAEVVWARAQADSSARYSGRAQFDFMVRTLAAAGEGTSR